MVKTKVRFDGLDVAAMVEYWNREALGRRVINIYNGSLNNDTYVFKLDKNKTNNSNDDDQKQQKSSSSSSSSDASSNLFLLFESGVRFHTTRQFENDTSTMPTPFCSKLRKCLRGLRLEQVQQLGNYDRVVTFHFGSGSFRHVIILELYARGNFIVTNADYQIVALLRSHDYQDAKVMVQVGQVYPVTYATTTTTTDLLLGDDPAQDGDQQQDEVLFNSKNVQLWMEQHITNPNANDQGNNDNDTNNNNNNNNNSGSKKKKKNSNSLHLKNFLLQSCCGVSHYGPSLLEHCILTSFEHETSKQQNYKTLSLQDWTNLQQVLQSEGSKILDGLQNNDDKKGYIIYQNEKTDKQDKDNGNNNNNNNDNDNDKNNNNNNNSSTTTSSNPHHVFQDKLLLEFQPHLLKQHANVQFLEYSSFDEAVDLFFGQLETQKKMLKLQQQQIQAQDKLAKIQKDQELRFQQLQEQQVIQQQQAQVVADNAQNVDATIQIINSALDSGMDWTQLQELIHVEQEQNQNPIALLIHELRLESDEVVLKLPTNNYNENSANDSYDDNDDDIDNNNNDDDTILVTISLKDTAHGNANQLFAKYRASKEKSAKTMEASTKVFQTAEANAKRQLEQVQFKKSTTVAAVRKKPLWFEKFHWMITSDNYLVVAGRDAQQNEVLVKRYLRPGDAYLHADVHGASSCILRAKRIRNPNNDSTTIVPLSLQALQEAGNFTVCNSSAWTSKMITSAWYVDAHQVSKTAPTGEYLTVGSFMIRGKKNYLAPSPLEMGLGILFQLDTNDVDSMARHAQERRDFGLLELQKSLQQQCDDDNDDIGGGGYMDNVPISSNKKKQPVKRESNEDKPKKGMNNEKEEGNHENVNQNESNVATKEKPEKQKNSEPINGEQPHDGASADEQQRNDNITNTSSDETKGFGKEHEQPPFDLTNNTNTDDSNNNKKKKKGLSVKERKLIKKYGSLEAAMEAEEERKRLEEEKRQQKLQRQANDDDDNDDDNNNNDDDDNTEMDGMGGSGGPVKRGKKAKMKRMQKRYADQDDEDRELALLALHAGEKSKKKGGNKKKVPVTSESQQKAAAETMAILRKDASIVAKQLPESVQTILAECVTVEDHNNNNEIIVKWDKFDADVLEQLQSLKPDDAQLAVAQRLQRLKQSTRVDNFSASLAGIIRTVRKYGHEGLLAENNNDENNNNDAAAASAAAKRKTKAEKEADEKAWKQTMAEEGIAAVDGNDTLLDDTVDDTAELFKLTGKPHAEDSILYAVPVCAPYSTLSQYQYRVKLTPGNLKRGKAAKQCVELFLKTTTSDNAVVNERNRTMIKRLADNDWVQVICPNVKISAPGASKVNKKQNGKGSKKKSK